MKFMVDVPLLLDDGDSVTISNRDGHLIVEPSPDPLWLDTRRIDAMQLRWHGDRARLMDKIDSMGNAVTVRPV